MLGVHQKTDSYRLLGTGKLVFLLEEQGASIHKRPPYGPNNTAILIFYNKAHKNGPLIFGRPHIGTGLTDGIKPRNGIS